MKVQTIILLIATLSTGVMAGIYFTWTNAVTPGIGKLSDLAYLKAFQSMNRVILNPMFYAFFMTSLLFTLLSAILFYKAEPSYIFWALLGAMIIYWLGMFAITIFGNVPLNNILEAADLDQFSVEEARKLRDRYELKWNKFNLLRTLSSIISFFLLIFSCLKLLK
jgi:uncharacterized membrane protein